MKYVVIFILSILLLANGYFRIPNELSTKTFNQDGDLLLAAPFSISGPGYGRETLCSDSFYYIVSMQYVEAVAFAVNAINERSDILPNVTLGFDAFDICLRTSASLAGMLHFIPMLEESKKCKGIPQDVKSRFKETIGLVTQIGSQRNQLIANFLNIFSIPQIASVSTSDILSNKDDYPYFSRVVPPDRFQAQTMVDLMLHFNWSYYSMVYSEGAYGANGMSQVKRIAKSKGLCNAYLGSVPFDLGDESIYVEIIQNLRRNKKAKVVVLFLEPIHIEKLLASIDKYNAAREFIWIGSDTFEEPDVENIPKTLHGAFSVQLTSKYDKAFIEHYRTLTPWNNPNNPWFSEYWTLAFNCTWETNSTDPRPPCDTFKSLTESKKHKDSPWISLLLDTVYAFGYALDNLIQNNCQDHVGEKTAMLRCVQSVGLTSYIRQVQFEGSSGPISFDENGDAFGGYTIKHFIPSDLGYASIQVGSWNRSTESLKLNESDIYWNTNDTIPLSKCSEECSLGEIRIQLELPCCWDCFKCHANDIVINGSVCMKCPMLTWPDERTATDCELI
ncbi:unnamed protein product, partial [Owenia fusiformis]